MKYKRGGQEVERSGFYRSRWGDELVDVMEEGGYAPAGEFGTGSEIMVERGLVWKPGARGFEWDLKDIFASAPIDSSPGHIFEDYPEFGENPSFIWERLSDRKEHIIHYRESYDRLTKEFKVNAKGAIDPSRLAGLRALRDTIVEEMDHRALRASRFTQRIPKYLVVLQAEAHWHIDQSNIDKKNHRKNQVNQRIKILWNQIIGGQNIVRIMDLYDRAAGQVRECPRFVWEAQRDVIEGLLWDREVELRLGVALRYRHFACCALLRCVATGDKIRNWEDRHGIEHLDLLTQIAYHVHIYSIEWRREIKDSSDIVPFDTLHEFCEWASGTIDSVDYWAVKKAVSNSEYWSGPGKGKKAPEKVIELVDGLYGRWLDYMRSLQ